jgi:hypothetical protein
MEDKAIQDLIDRYLLNQVSPEDKLKLLHMMEADPVFAQHVKESQETFRILQAARYRQLRHKLKSWDAGIQKHKRVKSKGLLFFCIAVLLILSVWCWLAYHYNSTCLAMRSFNVIEEKSISVYSSQAEWEEWQKSIDAFREEDFEKALYLFMALPETKDSFLTYRMHWNILLCQLAMNGPSPEWMEKLLVFTNSAPDPMKTEALKLWHTLQSPVYTKLYRGVISKTFTAVKPKII